MDIPWIICTSRNIGRGVRYLFSHKIHFMADANASIVI